MMKRIKKIRKKRNKKKKKKKRGNDNKINNIKRKFFIGDYIHEEFKPLYVEKHMSIRGNSEEEDLIIDKNIK